MSNFSPKTYRIGRYDSTNLGNISNYYNCFTLLEKPVKATSPTSGRNVYKISLAQMLYYMFDFGIGYNSKCVTTLTKPQQFKLCKYVNRHKTESDKRPATVADLKEKILNVVVELVNKTVKHGTSLISSKTNSIFPKYIFTLDKNLTTLKLKQTTGHDYVEMSDFENFAYASKDPSHSMPKYTNGYVPISAVRCVPKHDHDPHQKMSDSIWYNWGLHIEPDGKSAWSGHLGSILVSKAGGWPDNYLGTVRGITPAYVPVSASYTPSWDKPTGVSCFENKEKDPINIKNTSGGNMLSIRYHGRRYRLFKRID